MSTSSTSSHPKSSIEHQGFISFPDDCCRRNFHNQHTLGEIKSEFGVERDARDVLSDDVALAAEQHGIEYYPGLVKCPECGVESVVASFDNKPMLMKIRLEDFDEWAREHVEDARWRARKEFLDGA